MKEYFSGVRDWRELWRLKDRLPIGGEYKTAVQMDRDIAEQVADLPESDEPPTPLGYSRDTYVLLTIADLLQSVQSAIIAAAGADPPKVTPLQRPKTALHDVRDERHQVKMNRLISKFVHGGDPDV